MKEGKWPYIIITKAKKVITWLVVTIIFWQWLLLYLLHIHRYFFCFLQNLSSQLLLPEGKHKCFQVLRFSIENLSIRLEGHTQCYKIHRKSVTLFAFVVTPGSRTDFNTNKSCFDFRLVLFFLTKIQCYVTYFLAQQYIFGSPMSAL